ncbi:hypothetical protein Tco_0837705 [Tanacetum coccineum]
MFRQYSGKKVKTLTDEDEKKKYFNHIQVRASKAMQVISWMQEEKTFEYITSTHDMDVKTVREFVNFFFAFRKNLLNRETIEPEDGLEPETQGGDASGTPQSEEEKNSKELKLVHLRVEKV